jgi:hypothetical protein
MSETWSIGQQESILEADTACCPSIKHICENMVNPVDVANNTSIIT